MIGGSPCTVDPFILNNLGRQFEQMNGEKIILDKDRYNQKAIMIEITNDFDNHQTVLYAWGKELIP